MKEFRKVKTVDDLISLLNSHESIYQSIYVSEPIKKISQISHNFTNISSSEIGFNESFNIYDKGSLVL